MHLGNRISGITINYGKRKLDVSAKDILELEVVNMKANISFEGSNFSNRDSLFYTADSVHVYVGGGHLYTVDSVDQEPSTSYAAAGEVALDDFEDHYFDVDNPDDDIFVDIYFQSVLGQPLRLVLPRDEGPLVSFSPNDGGYLTIRSCKTCKNVTYCACTNVG
ncbi:hypothetical protein Bp8pC_211 [Bacillus phage Bp8p-C]|uniref:Uncharacterized protein n=2 Tax=Agatevirus Bp8pC TaxID=1910937 RepID=A0A0A0PUY6_9CAUD|nr:hypothetical protein AXJ20_gp137 [Bacillus phage Bp8p-C]YP_009784511.1 hypothetical protein QLX39_gp137 [Bacillus phage Bp8p-T]AHJ87641.1 hypothetical protein Bp8pC_211 [Bacillus phage Bp8p-C]AHJ87852.1 hypothetical protein Bp8pT_211 [Bacillus phage Bp8p-T]